MLFTFATSALASRFIVQVEIQVRATAVLVEVVLKSRAKTYQTLVKRCLVSKWRNKEEIKRIL